MPRKTWTVDVEGHEIQVENFWSLSPLISEEILRLDGTVVDQFRTTKHLNAQRRLKAELLRKNGRIIQIEARLGQKAFGIGCQIFADGVQIGGDKRMMFAEPDDVKRWQRSSFWEFYREVAFKKLVLPISLIFISLELAFTDLSLVTMVLTTAIFTLLTSLVFGFVWQQMIKASN